MIVIDSNAAINLVLNQTNAQTVAKIVEQAKFIIAPELIRYEVTNVLWKYYNKDYLTKKESEKALESTIQIPDEYITVEDLIDEVFETTCQLKTTAYDMFFAILARRHNAQLLTFDKKLKALAKK